MIINSSCLFGFFTICLVLFFPALTKAQTSSQYSEYPDTLILETHLERGMGLFPADGSWPNFMDTSELIKEEYFPDFGFIYPGFLDSLKASVMGIYFETPEFYNYVNKKVYQPSFRGKNDKLILIIKGYLKGREVFIMDQNHNQNLTDDPIREFHKLEWRNSQDLIRYQYDMLVNGENIQKYGYFNIGNYNGKILGFVSQYAETEFSLNGQLFKLGVMDENYNSFCFFSPKLALLTTGGIMKDTLTKREIASLDEYVFLGDQPYRYDRFYNGSGTLVLVKEKDYERQIGIQMGLLAPDFRIKTTRDEIITKS